MIPRRQPRQTILSFLLLRLCLCFSPLSIHPKFSIDAFFCDSLAWHHSHQSLFTSTSTSSHAFSGSAAETNLLQLSTSHFTSQALHAFVTLKIPDVFLAAEESLTVDEIVLRLAHRHTDPIVVPKDFLFRILRLLTAADVVYQKIRTVDPNAGNVHTNGKEEPLATDTIISFGLTESGIMLQQPETADELSQPTTQATSMAPFVLHWIEEPIWKAFADLPCYMSDSNSSAYPFDRANKGIKASEYYSSQAAPSSSRYRSQVAERVSGSEIPALMEAIDWAQFDNKVIVDIGGGYGDLMAAVVEKCKQEKGFDDSSLNMTCYCLDLASVVDGIEAPAGVTLVAGDMFISETIPVCDLIVTKHVLCDWPDDEVARMLKTSHSVLSPNGKLIIVDAVLLDGPNASSKWQIQTSIDVLLMLTGRHMDRSVSQWRSLASSAGFRLDEVISCPSSPSLNLTVLSKA